MLKIIASVKDGSIIANIISCVFVFDFSLNLGLREIKSSRGFSANALSVLLIGFSCLERLAVRQTVLIVAGFVSLVPKVDLFYYAVSAVFGVVSNVSVEIGHVLLTRYYLHIHFFA